MDLFDPGWWQQYVGAQVHAVMAAPAPFGFALFVLSAVIFYLTRGHYTGRIETLNATVTQKQAQVDAYKDRAQILALPKPAAVLALSAPEPPAPVASSWEPTAGPDISDLEQRLDRIDRLSQWPAKKDILMVQWDRLLTVGETLVASSAAQNDDWFATYGSWRSQLKSFLYDAGRFFPGIRDDVMDSVGAGLNEDLKTRVIVHNLKNLQAKLERGVV